MAAALSILAMLNGWHGGRAWPWLTGGALLFLTAALLYPAFLNSLNRAWTKLGLLLHDEPEILRSSSHQLCLTSAEAGQFCHSAGTS